MLLWQPYELMDHGLTNKKFTLFSKKKKTVHTRN
jgi:hypothetical protein